LGGNADLPEQLEDEAEAACRTDRTTLKRSPWDECLAPLHASYEDRGERLCVKKGCVFWIGLRQMGGEDREVCGGFREGAGEIVIAGVQVKKVVVNMLLSWSLSSLSFQTP